jgi:hypothetical protein
VATRGSSGEHGEVDEITLVVTSARGGGGAARRRSSAWRVELRNLQRDFVPPTVRECMDAGMRSDFAELRHVYVFFIQKPSGNAGPSPQRRALVVVAR